MGVYGEILHLLSNQVEIWPQSWNAEMIKVSLSLIGQEVKMISPKIRLHWDIIRTIVSNAVWLYAFFPHETFIPFQAIQLSICFKSLLLVVHVNTFSIRQHIKEELNLTA